MSDEQSIDVVEKREIFEQIDIQLLTNYNFINKIRDDRFNIYIFKIPEQYICDVHCYLNNEIDLFSDKYIKSILKCFNDIEFIYQLLLDNDLLRNKMSEELGYDIPNNISLITNPKLFDLTWKMTIKT